MSHSDSAISLGVMTGGYFEKMFMVGFTNYALCQWLKNYIGLRNELSPR